MHPRTEGVGIQCYHAVLVCCLRVVRACRVVVVTPCCVYIYVGSIDLGGIQRKGRIRVLCGCVHDPWRWSRVQIDWIR